MKGNHHDQDWLDTENTNERTILDLRMIGIRQGLTLGRLLYHRASAPLPEQLHPHWVVLVFVLSGRQNYVVDGDRFDLRGGEMLRIPPGCRYSTGTSAELKGELAWLILKGDLEQEERALGMSPAGARQVFETVTSKDGPRVCSMAEDARHLIESIFTAWERRDDLVVSEMIRNRVASLVIGAAGRVTAPASMEEQENDYRIRKVVSWMGEHPDRVASSDELAELAGLSSSRFHVHFKRLIGSSPKDYWVRLRVERAATRLREVSDSTVTDVAHEFGFSSSQYFATVFRRYLGLSPHEYRSQVSR